MINLVKKWSMFFWKVERKYLSELFVFTVYDKALLQTLIDQLLLRKFSKHLNFELEIWYIEITLYD